MNSAAKLRGNLIILYNIFNIIFIRDSVAEILHAVSEELVFYISKTTEICVYYIGQFRISC
jgi:hypothetical protein